MGSGYLTGSGLLVKNVKNRLFATACYSIAL